MSLKQISKAYITNIEQENLIYAINEEDKTAQVVGNKSVDIYIPRYINYNEQKYTVTQICDCAFYNSQKITSIQFAPDSEIKTISENVFTNSSIESISIPSSLIELKPGWCSNTPQLKSITVMPNNPYFKSYDDKFLLKKSSHEKENFDVLIFSIYTIETETIPDFVEVIASRSFENRPNLRSINFSSNSKLRIIEENAFLNTAIESISIPNSLVEIKDGWCVNTPNLTKITVMPNNPYFKLYDDKLLLKKSTLEKENYDILVLSTRDIETVTIPDSIEIISPFSFEKCSRLKSIEFSPNSKLQTIGKYAFSCSSVKSVSIPASLIQISEFAFNQCMQLHHIDAPLDSKLQTIENCAFFGSTINSISIPENLTELKDGWCSNTPNLAKITVMPNNPYFKLYDDKLLLKKSTLEKENYDVLVLSTRDIETVTIPDFVEIISPFSFDKCLFLNEIVFSPNSKLRTIGKSAFSNSSIVNISIPSAVTQICEHAFSSCDLQKICFPIDSQLQVIEKEAFSFSSINDFLIPQHVTKIGEGAFYTCSMLEKVFIQDKSELQTIPEEAFAYCNNFQQIQIPTDCQLKKFCKNSFSYSSIKMISIPSSLVQIDEFAFYMCKEFQQILIPTDSNLQVIGRNAFHGSSIESIYIPASVTQICERAFYGCYQIKRFEISADSNLHVFEEDIFSNSSIESISITNSLVEIKDGWCVNTPNLKNITVMPNNPYFKSYDDKLLLKKSTLEKENYDVLVLSTRDIETTTIPDSIEIISPFSFECCKNLVGIEFSPNSKLRQISFRSFSHSSITKFTIPTSVIQIDERAFCLCDKLQQVKVLNSAKLQTIGKYAFYRTSIRRFLIPSNVTQICEGAFYECQYLQKIEIPPDLKIQEIAKNAFCCTQIDNFVLSPYVTKIGESSFSSCTELQRIEIPQNSKLRIIEEKALNGTKIESILIPKSLVDVKEGWCCYMYYLKNITVMPNNPNFTLYDNKFLLKKSTPEKENFDVLALAIRNIKIANIPDFIETISSYSFEHCSDLRRIKFSPKSKLRTIGQHAFYSSSIENILIPSNVTQIGMYALSNCKRLHKVEFMPNSKLQKIDLCTFGSSSSIEKIVIPASVTQINEHAFDCPIKKIIFPPDSKLKIINEFAFFRTLISCFSIPPSMIKIKSKTFSDCRNLQIVYIDDINSLQFIDKDAFDEYYNIIIMAPEKLLSRVFKKE